MLLSDLFSIVVCDGFERNTTEYAAFRNQTTGSHSRDHLHRGRLCPRLELARRGTESYKKNMLYWYIYNAFRSFLLFPSALRNVWNPRDEMHFATMSSTITRRYSEYIEIYCATFGIARANAYQNRPLSTRSATFSSSIYPNFRTPTANMDLVCRKQSTHVKGKPQATCYSTISCKMSKRRPNAENYHSGTFLFSQLFDFSAIHCC